MQLSIRDASRFVIGAAIIRDMALKNAPESNITFENVSIAALREGGDGQDLRTSINKLADQEAGWFRSTPPHTLATDRVMHTRSQEVRTLNATNLAGLATLEQAPAAIQGDPAAEAALQESYQAAIRAIDEMPGSTVERRALLQTLKTQGIEACGDADFVMTQFNVAQEAYLKQMMAERLSPYQNTTLERSDDLDLGM
jgi:hypothetical protein